MSMRSADWGLLAAYLAVCRTSSLSGAARSLGLSQPTVRRQIEALESALGSDGAADTGERAFDNVRKALRVVQEQLSKGGLEERLFAEHLRTHLNIGFECLYSQAEGRIWG